MTHRTLIFLCLFALLIATCKPIEQAGDTTTSSTDTSTTSVQKPPQCPPAGGCVGSACPDSITTASSIFPASACPFEGEGQNGVDTFAWNEFIALNWPANRGNCTPDTNKSILNVKSGDGTVAVWQTWMPPDRLFVAPGQQPAPWCSGNGLDASGSRPMTMVAKADERFASLGPAFAMISEIGGVEEPGGVLTDQNGRWVRYEIVLNQDEYNYAMQNKLWSKAGQQAFQSAGNTSINLPTGPTGAVEIKSSWKVLTDAEISGGRYFTTVATVYNTPGGAPSPGKNPVTLGLVGLHIIHKTEQQTTFFWSTFEQVDNDRVFFNPNSTTPQNTQTATKPYIELNPDGTAHNLPVQVKRVHSVESIDSTAIPLNAYYQAILGSSVFANYRLISTQWTTGGAPQGTPSYVSNVTLETYVQNHASGKSTGCLACHTSTTPTAVKNLNGDFSFLFGGAQ